MDGEKLSINILWIISAIVNKIKWVFMIQKGIEFYDLAITIEADSIIIPNGLSEENLFLFLKKDIINCLSNNVAIIHFGYAPDNTADNQDELLYDGTQLRVICNEKYLGVDIETPIDEVVKSFKKLVENYTPYWTTIIEERGFIKKETTIDLLYRDVF